MFSIWSAIHADKTGKHLWTMPSAQSMLTPLRATACKGSNKSWNMSCSVSALIRLWCWSAKVDFESFGKTGNSARRRTAIDPGLLRRVDRRLPSVIYPGHAFFSPEKLLRWVWSNIPIMGTRVVLGERVSYNRSTRVSIKLGGKRYLDVLPPVRCMHFHIYLISTVVVFPPRRLD